MSTELIINASLPETRIALMENGEIQDLLIERATGKGIVGNIYKGRVTRVLPGMQAAFVDIGLEKAAFLYVDDVFVHSEIWEAEEGPSSETEREAPPEKRSVNVRANDTGAAGDRGSAVATSAADPAPSEAGASSAAVPPLVVDDAEAAQWKAEIDAGKGADEAGDEEEGDEGDDSLDSEMEDRASDIAHGDDDEDEEDDEDDDQGPVGMGPPPGDEGEGSGAGSGDPQGTVRPTEGGAQASGGASSEGGSEGGGAAPGEGGESGDSSRRRRHRRGRRGGRFRKRTREGQEEQGGAEGSVAGESAQASAAAGPEGAEHLDNAYEGTDEPENKLVSDRSAMSEQGNVAHAPEGDSDDRGQTGRPQVNVPGNRDRGGQAGGEGRPGGKRPEFKEQRDKGRRIKSKPAAKPVRGQAQIQDLLKEGQEVIVQVAKDPIATKGARLTCHISLPGRHLVCMPTIDHVGVSRRIDRDDERRKLREYVERNRPKGLGFIVRTASGRGQSEKRIKQDIDYLTRLWSEIREKAGQVSAPALVYEDLNSVLRAIRDWVTEDIDKVIVDSRYHHNDILRFVSHFMPSLKQKVELYNGDAPIFDAFNISTELARGMERKVWLKSGGYLVIDQAEALVAIDVNTGRFVGKKNLEDTILKTNLEAVQEIAYQLRLRNCGGIIILDLIDMEREENKQRVYRALEEALKKDRARPSILKISELGLVEMTRKRTRDTMVRALCESCAHCEGKGFVKSKVTMAYEIMRELERVGIERDLGRVLVQAHPDVVDVLAIDERDTLDQLERRYRKPIFLQAVMDYPIDRFEVTGDKLEKGERAPIMLGSGGEERGRDSRDRDRGGDRGGRGDRDRGGRGGRNDRGDRGRGRDRNRGGDRDRPQARNPVDAMSYVGSPEASGPPTGSTRNPDEGGAPHGLPRPRQSGAGGEDHGDEDRLAFLRAQAAQDAALARMGTPGAGPSPGAAALPGEGGPRRVVTVTARSQPLPPREAGAGGQPSREGRGEGKEGREGREGEDALGRRGRRGRRGGKHRRGPGGPGRAPGAEGSGAQVSPRGEEGSSGNGGGSSGGANGGGDGGSSGGDNSTPPVT